MACTPTPTQTLYEVLTTTTASTSFTEFVSTVPPELTTLATTICLISTVDPLGNTTCIASRTQDITSTIQGECDPDGRNVWNWRERRLVPVSIRRDAGVVAKGGWGSV